MKKLASNSAFFTPRVVISFAFCAIGVLVALLAFSLYSGGYAFAENPDASNNHGIAGKNPIAEKYDTLVMRVYFRDRAERDRLAQELNAEEVLTTGGYLTVIRDRDLYYSLTARGLCVEIDENSSLQPQPPSNPALHFLRRVQDGGRNIRLPRSEGGAVPRSGRKDRHRRPPGVRPILARASYPVPGTVTTCLCYTSRTATYQAPNRSSGRTAIYTPARSLRQKSSCA